MNKEKEFIEIISAAMPKSGARLNRPFESDSEIIKHRGRRLLFSMDEFSHEDVLGAANPRILGWNMAVGAVSDIFASGGIPLYYAHSLTVGPRWTKNYVADLSRGVAEVLARTGAAFIGGDFGTSSIWRYTATVIGEVPRRLLLRTGASTGDSIYVSGVIGGGNLRALLHFFSGKRGMKKISSVPENRLKLRTKEAALIRKYAASCIDTSDGLLNAVNTLADLNDRGYILTDLPYDRRAARILKAYFSLPVTLLFLGECGEYELLFTVRQRNERRFLAQALKQNLKFFKIGRITTLKTRMLNEYGRNLDLAGFKARARDFRTPESYLKSVRSFLEGS